MRRRRPSVLILRESTGSLRVVQEASQIAYHAGICRISLLSVAKNLIAISSCSPRHLDGSDAMGVARCHYKLSVPNRRGNLGIDGASLSARRHPLSLEQR